MHSLWPPFTSCPPAAMLPLRLCRLWPRSPPTRLFAEAARQRSGPSNYYELLGVHPDASTEEVKRAFFSKSKELHPDRDPGNPALHSRFVELSEAYQVLSREQSRRNYDQQLRSATPPRSSGTAAHPRSAHQAHSSWAPPNAQYWAQFHHVRPQGPESRQQQHRHNQRVMGYCLLIMLAGMGLHYVAFSWSRCTVASWTKRIGSSQLSTMTHGPGPGPTEPGSSRSDSRGSSCSHHLGLPKAQESCPQAPAPEQLTCVGSAVFPAGLPTPQNACNKVVLSARVRLPPSGPPPRALA
ncbi:dnaJ homolog subfamily C member 4 isoform X1 [Rousettus aegyptiacus]|uniref:dnaJ homolog subfamily C member 4 isoform X1 n=1 Tax=Rousettus aegyptiacus TaxID=9407 RepID=UPI000787C955|nr:dnaJ homolog subfamily C member 4 isoform X1 [Rousettus aegyptiacus]